MTAITPELIARYDRPGPRYTSYPTAAEFHEGVDVADYEGRLADAASRPDEPLGLYVHLPFCEERCHYCGCNVVITRKHEVSHPYLDALKKEIGLVADRLGGRTSVRQLHWGGGTPTYQTPAEMASLFEALTARFELEEDAEVAIEVDPRVTSFEHLATLRELGFNRLSLGIQDFTLEVQQAVNRVQSFELTSALVDEARRLGFDSINADLIYGLPNQTPENYARTIEQILAIRPERVAVYSYAHMPWIKPHQRLMCADHLPPADAKLEIFAAAVEGFRNAGYAAIGMDHFALPEDELGQALEDGTLWRNFMGYTVRHAPEFVGLGMSAIGDVGGAFVQNARKLHHYHAALVEGRLPAERGYVLSDDDRIRRYAITALMCTFQLDLAEVSRRFHIDAQAYFAKEWEALAAHEADGFVRRGDGRIDVLEPGRLFVRNVCMEFDAYLDPPGEGARPRFSRTV